jgi:hypothetical protein
MKWRRKIIQYLYLVEIINCKINIKQVISRTVVVSLVFDDQDSAVEMKEAWHKS